MSANDKSVGELGSQVVSASVAPTEDPRSLEEIERIAQKRLPQVTWDFYSNGADEEKPLRRNAAAYDELYVIPRVLRDVSLIDTSMQIWGRRMPLPIAIAPSAMQRMAGEEGEADSARAALDFGITMGLSSQSTTSLEDVIACSKEAKSEASNLTRFWFQLYLTGNEERNRALVKRAEGKFYPPAGYEALVVTVDAPVLGNRLRERRTPLVLPSHLTLANYEASASGKWKRSLNRQLMDARSAKQAAEIRKAGGADMIDPSTTWEDITSLRRTTNMKIILKGIMAPEDAELAIRHGVDAIVVSNHGGRQLGCTSSTIEALPGVVAAVKGRLPVIIDGGIRRGSDVFKALCLGADLVMVGRPILWGLAFNGKAGVMTVLNILERELAGTMALAGVAKVKGLDSSYLRLARDMFVTAKL